MVICFDLTPGRAYLAPFGFRVFCERARIHPCRNTATWARDFSRWGCAGYINTSSRARSPGILIPSPVILSEAKDHCSLLRINAAKDLPFFLNLESGILTWRRAYHHPLT